MFSWNFLNLFIYLYLIRKLKNNLIKYSYTNKYYGRRKWGEGVENGEDVGYGVGAVLEEGVDQIYIVRLVPSVISHILHWFDNTEERGRGRVNTCICWHWFLFCFSVFSLDTIKIMDEQTSSRRITIGIQTKQQKLDNYMVKIITKKMYRHVYSQVVFSF